VEVREEVRQLAEPLAEDDGFEVVDVEQASQGNTRVIRVFLDRQGGVSIQDCARFSRRLSDALDMNQILPGRYHLEVSSPGLERPIRTLEHVQRFSGARVTVQTHELRDGRRRFDGALLGPDEAGRAGVRNDEGDEFWFDWAEVRSARLVVDPLEALRREKAARPPKADRPRGGTR